MVPGLITAAVGLASEFAPKIVGWLAGDKAEETAEKVVETAKAITGTSTPEDALQALKNDPELALKYTEAMNEFHLGLEREYTARFQEIHKTIRAELSSTDPFNRRWRAFYGYCVAGAWLFTFSTFLGIMIYAVGTGKNLAETIDATTKMIGAMVPLWGIALTILGYNIRKRSQEKEVAAGEKSGGLISTNSSC